MENLENKCFRRMEGDYTPLNDRLIFGDLGYINSRYITCYSFLQRRRIQEIISENKNPKVEDSENSNVNSKKKESFFGAFGKYILKGLETISLENIFGYHDSKKN